MKKKTAGGASSDGSANGAERNFRMKYTTRNNKTAIVRAIILFLVAFLIVFGIALMLEDAEAKLDAWEPNVSYPMANAHISWDQTYYGGGMKR